MRNNTYGNTTKTSKKKRKPTKLAYFLMVGLLIFGGLACKHFLIDGNLETVEAEVTQEKEMTEKKSKSKKESSSDKEKTDTAVLTRIELGDNSQPEITDKQAIKYLESLKEEPKIDCSIEELVKTYVQLGNAEGIRWDIAFAQAILETGKFSYGGDVQPEQNNFAGINATTNGTPASFDTVFGGILAQVQHLKAYANKEDCQLDIRDPRFDLVERGWAPYVEWLGINENPNNIKGEKEIGWAIDKNYGYKIIKVLDTLKEIEN